jgi:hypothetical protein
MSEPIPAGRAAAPQSQSVQWVIAILLAVIATILVLRELGGGAPVALAQNQGMAGARGVFAFTGQIDASRYGLFMLDVDQGTIWAYEIDNTGSTRKLRLIAGRTFIYDRYLQDFNCAKPDFRMVQELVAQQRAQTAARATPDVGADGRENPAEEPLPAGKP